MNPFGVLCSYFVHRQVHVIDLRTLAAFRIALGAFLLFDLVSRLSVGRYDLAWYTSEPAHHSYLRPSDNPHKGLLHRFWFIRGSQATQCCLFAITGLLSLLLLLGWQCNGLTKTCLFIAQVSQQSRNMHVSDGSDSFSRHLLFWICFLPIAECWSLDSYFKTKRQRRQIHEQKHVQSTSSPFNSSDNESGVVSSIACLAIRLQIALMYWGTAFNRLIDKHGWYSFLTLNSPSEWWFPKLSAVHYAIAGSFASRENFVTKLARSNANISRAMTLQSLFIETVPPFICLLSSEKTLRRAIGGLLLVILHFNLLIVFNLPNWQLLGMLTQVLWLPSAFWDRICGPYCTYAQNDYKKTDGDHKAINETNSTRRSSLKFNLRQSISLFLQFFFFLYMLLDFAGNRGWISKFDNGDIGEGLRLSQYWVMYGTLPRTSQNVIVTGILDNGSAIDIWEYIKSGRDVSPDQVGLVPYDMTDRYPSPRWDRAFSRWAPSQEIEKIRTWAIAACKLLKDDRQNRSKNLVQELHIQVQKLHIAPPGSKERYLNERGSAAKRRRDVNFQVQCHAKVLTKK